MRKKNDFVNLSEILTPLLCGQLRSQTCGDQIDQVHHCCQPRLALEHSLSAENSPRPTDCVRNGLPSPAFANVTKNLYQACCSNVQKRCSNNKTIINSKLCQDGKPLDGKVIFYTTTVSVECNPASGSSDMTYGNDKGLNLRYRQLSPASCLPAQGYASQTVCAL